MDEPKAFTLDDISALAELPRRTVRYYIQSGLIDRPQGVGKGAYYTQRARELTDPKRCRDRAENGQVVPRERPAGLRQPAAHGPHLVVGGVFDRGVLYCAKPAS